MGGGTKNIYAKLVDKDDQNLLARTFVNIASGSVNPCMTGKAIEKVQKM